MSRPFLLWEHDGVLVDTERWWFEATRQVLDRLDIELTQSAYLERVTAGLSCFDLARARGLPEVEIEVHRSERDAPYHELIRTRPIEIDGVSDVLAELSSRHRMAVVTTARRADLAQIHADRDLLEPFEFVLTIEDYARAKPHPDPYRAGLERFGAGRRARRWPSRTRRAGSPRRGLRASTASWSAAPSLRARTSAPPGGWPSPCETSPGSWPLRPRRTCFPF